MKIKELLRKCLPILLKGLLLVSFFYFCILFLSGARFFPSQAAKGTTEIDNSSVLLGTEGKFPYKVYVYENAENYCTVITEFKFPLWRSDCILWAKNEGDMVKLVGWCSYGKTDAGKGITVVPVQALDENVAYIEMGLGEDRQSKEVKRGETVLFSWDKQIPWNDLNAIAYSMDKKALYSLGYEIVNSTIHSDELRWLPYEEEKQN